MDACVNAYGMRMLARFADMTLDEMEYRGSGFWKKAKGWLKKNAVKIVLVTAIAAAAVIAPVGLMYVGAVLATSASTAVGATIGSAILAGSFVIGRSSILAGANIANRVWNS